MGARESIRRNVKVPAGEGIVLDAAFESPLDPLGTIVFAHGSGSSRMSPRNRYVAIELRRAGFATLLLDLLTEREDLDPDRRFDVGLLARRLAAAVEWARAEPSMHGLPVALFGASTGAAAALDVAGAMGRGIAAVVSRGGRPDLALPRSLEAVTAPTLLIVGGEDRGAIDLNASAARHMRCPKSLRIVPGATHLFEEPGALEAVAAEAAHWFRLHLRGNGRASPERAA